MGSQRVRAEARRIATKLGLLPLAIAVAGAASGAGITRLSDAQLSDIKGATGLHWRCGSGNYDCSTGCLDAVSGDPYYGEPYNCRGKKWQPIYMNICYADDTYQGSCYNTVQQNCAQLKMYFRSDCVPTPGHDYWTTLYGQSWGCC
jgi:hypothetical protein